ncbi:unnamed protein product [Owenia fusiformis]|uniref:Uncharacterized protein n=1 Tax=Owenia fusiformis TaxID=6347 RepID=A0A8S4PN98_OWEFU|nr:unnamed protein product [Owenia fusiformis]
MSMESSLTPCSMPDTCDLNLLLAPSPGNEQSADQCLPTTPKGLSQDLSMVSPNNTVDSSNSSVTRIKTRLRPRSELPRCTPSSTRSLRSRLKSAQLPLAKSKPKRKVAKKKMPSANMDNPNSQFDVLVSIVSDMKASIDTLKSNIECNHYQ